MTTLHIEHPITDLRTWADAFAVFAEARRRAGVRAHRVLRPVDDPGFIVVELDFDTSVEAEAFRQFLHSVVWARPENAPALAGAPRTRLLELEPL